MAKPRRRAVVRAPRARRRRAADRRHRRDEGGRESPDGDAVSFDVSDAAGLHEALKGKVTIEWGPEVYFYHRREFAFHDPDGHLIIISEETDDPVTCVED